MEPPGVFDFILIILSLVFLALLSSTEASFISANRYRIRSLIEKGDKRALALKEIIDRHDRLFSAVVVSSTLFTIFAGSLGTAIAIRSIGGKGAVIVSTLVMTFFIVLFGELAPKTLAVTYSEKFALFLARPMKAYMRLISPVIWFSAT
jgi:Mg2+/Co2+ transporter CorB